MANTSTLIARRDYGLKIAMPGFDAQYAGDNQLLFNSSFPILQIKILAQLGIARDGGEWQFDAPNYGGEYIGYKTAGGGFGAFVYRWYHGLGYPPLYLPIGANGVQFGSLGWSVDDEYIWYAAATPPLATVDGVKVASDSILVCPIDIERDIEYPYTAMPLELPKITDLDYGFKSIEFGDIESDNFDNLGVNPRLQSQMLLAVKTKSTLVAGSNEISYQLPAGMTVDDVLAYGLIKSTSTIDDFTNTSWSHIYQYSNQVPRLERDRTNNIIKIVISGSEQDVALVVTRMPMIAPVVTTGTM